MNLRPNTRFTEEHLNIHCNWGGQGDMIARLPAIAYLGKHEHIRLTVYWPDYFLPLAKVLLPETSMRRYLPTSAIVYADTKIPLIDFIPERMTSCHVSLIQHGFLTATLRLPPTPEDEFYPKANLKSFNWSERLNYKKLGNYVVVTPLFTAKTREWNGVSINDTIKGIHELGYDTVLLGKTEKSEVGNGATIQGNLPEGFDRSLATLDLIDKTSLIDCLGIIERATAVVGLDNGLLHLAGCTNTPTVWAFTNVLSKERIPKGVRTEVVTPDVSCYGCQSRVCMVRHNFVRCPFGDYLCIPEITSVKMLHALKKVLDLPI